MDPPVNLRDYMEELVRFTLHSHIKGTLEFKHMGLSRDFCSTLLEDDPCEPCSEVTDFSEGVLPYPLYKRLASNLVKCTSFGAFSKTCSDETMVDDLSSLKQKETEWKKLIMETESEIMNILKSVGFELHVQESFFSKLKDGLKTVEGRCAVGNYNRIESGNLIFFNKCVLFEVQGIRHYTSFSDMLEAESLQKVLPGVETVEEGVKIYRRFYTEEQEQSNGVLAIGVSKVALQPFISLARLFSGLGYAGVQCLLGLAHTIGTIPDALPPSRSTLLSSFKLPYKPDVEGSALTHGARALAKHTHRSSNRYWGSLDGSDSDKNTIAMDVINNIIAHCCWLNVHIVPPHGAVFEIRVADGYGARWTKDGSKFIGFLEPYMEDGHLKGWKH
ncbi:RNA-binding ASCH domain protein [Quillaja saponaria]|uniref:RNA-binding ASCH domain protein n=1 Tax=Quillaja saponaria TaxID=32244 RepID=A0AAD7PA94_QUISA|nr:RNA-binding ASCH domain protein [Quillaja saponaria]